MAKHIMVDLETMSTRPDAVILSIGACRFDETKIDDAGFYASVSLDQPGRHTSEDTLKWWMKQSPAAQRVFHEDKVGLTTALLDFVVWCEDVDYIWSNGADFDIPMINHALDSAGIPIPWKFWNQRCFRTMKNLGIAKTVKAPPNGAKHNALSDAVAQAEYLQAIWKVVK